MYNVQYLSSRSYDVAKCLDPQSPFRTLIKQLQGIPVQETKYVENTASFHLSLGGRISVGSFNYYILFPISYPIGYHRCFSLLDLTNLLLLGWWYTFILSLKRCDCTNPIK